MTVHTTKYQKSKQLNCLTSTRPTHKSYCLDFVNGSLQCKRSIKLKNVYYSQNCAFCSSKTVYIGIGYEKTFIHWTAQGGD